METILKVEGMTCGHCKEAVEGAVNKLDGVKSAAVDLEAANVTVDHEESVTVDAMKEAIEDQGYDVVK
ncbi:copper chaperone CopZ [Macrococcoides goetzii]|uniref:Heavy-metal-associated domain-containing protein n=1 Tax=Macrococcoides goetzii TaxID=1891097 RepID=A0A395GC47_9STAP|nr:copper chaperone CopZ [Macrococcus sp. PK]MBC9874484.1 copper chaperone CopZ [Macrococcus bohemicus]RAI81388.1 heavy-metal-associated domain-containing protein [Macrococcus goetzii]MCH4985662.1 copper chaperone CopZ [Macrococcus sp. PK]TDM40599.1 copper chaperone CopZ [Macrococcus goetzii]TDM45360.1 copper chaperone CopZ [Macrococcus goetzii]